MSQTDITNNENVSLKLEKFFSKFRLSSFKKGSIVLSSNQSQYDIYYIKKGAVKIYSIADNGEVVVYHVAKAGSYFPLMLAVAGKQNRYNYEAIIETEVYCAPVEKVIEFIKSDKEILFDIVTRFGSGLEGMMTRIESLVLGSALMKVASILSYFAMECGSQCNEGVIIKQKFSHSDIASWIGVSRETVSRQMKNLQTENVISYRDGMVVIHDFHKLMTF